MTNCPHCQTPTVGGRRVEASGKTVAVRRCPECWWTSADGVPPKPPRERLTTCEYCYQRFRAVVPMQRFCSPMCANRRPNSGRFGARTGQAAR